MNDRRRSWGWLIVGGLLAVFAIMSALGAVICLISGSLAGVAFGLGWTVVGYWFARGMFERGLHPEPRRTPGP